MLKMYEKWRSRDNGNGDNTSLHEQHKVGRYGSVKEGKYIGCEGHYYQEREPIIYNEEGVFYYIVIAI